MKVPQTTDEFKRLTKKDLAIISDRLLRGINLINCQASLDMFDELMINEWQILIDHEYDFFEELQERYIYRRREVKNEASN